MYCLVVAANTVITLQVKPLCQHSGARSNKEKKILNEEKKGREKGNRGGKRRKKREIKK